MAVAISTVTVSGAGTRVQFSSADSRPWRVITVTARPRNGSAAYVGLSDVTSTLGIQLLPGLSYSFLVPQDAPAGSGITLQQLYADAAVSNDRVDYYAFSP